MRHITLYRLFIYSRIDSNLIAGLCILTSFSGIVESNFERGRLVMLELMRTEKKLSIDD